MALTERMTISTETMKGLKGFIFYKRNLDWKEL